MSSSIESKIQGLQARLQAENENSNRMDMPPRVNRPMNCK